MYKKMKVVELKSLAREQGIRGYSRLRKGELINLLKLMKSQMKIFKKCVM